MNGTNVAEFSVSELAFALKRTVEESFGLVRVRGEISGFKRAASGHVYLALKDERAVLDAVAWRNTLGRLSFEPGDGLEVICTGRLTTYPGRSKYQLVIERMEPAGIGALLAQLEERRRRLDAEGLFDPARKRILPILPEVIGIVTSPTGSVIRDILHRIAERFPRHVLVWPVLVQGEGARDDIAAAIEGFSRMPSDGPVPRPDLLIVARGGGSIEDLWAFNEEIVVRAAASCTIPLISAVGHETDTTLIDFAADRRAPTPTAAAEIAVPVRSELLLRIEQLQGRKHAAVARSVGELRRMVEGLGRALPHPSRLLAMSAQRLDDLSERLRLRTPNEVVRTQKLQLSARASRLDELMRDTLRRARHGLERADLRLTTERIDDRIADGRSAFGRLAPRLDRVMMSGIGIRKETIQRLGALCRSLGPQRVLERGYVLVRDGTGQLVTSSIEARSHAHLTMTFKDGDVAVQTGSEPRSGKKRGTTQGTTRPKQENLF